MKKNFFLRGLFALFSFSAVHSQSLTMENISYLNHRDFGTLSNDTSVKHYMFHLTTQQLEKKQSEGIISFLNEDLTEIKKEKFVLEEGDFFCDIKNNSNRIIASFHNVPKETTTFRIYSDKGELIKTKEFHVPKNLFAPQFYKYAEKIGDFSLVYPVKNKGFLITEVAKKKRQGYNFHFIADDDSKSWVYESPKDHNNRKTATPLFANDNIIVIMEKEWGSLYDRQPTFKAIALDANTGKELFSTSHEYEKIPNFYTKAFVNQKNEIILFGETYNLDNNYPDDDYNNGYFIEKYTITGNLISANKLSFNDLNFKKALGFSEETKPKEMGTIFFYNLAESNGKLYAIGEISRRDKQGFTALKGFLATATGTFINQNWQSKYAMGKMIALELDDKTLLTNTHLLAKEETFTGLNGLVVRPYFNLSEMEYDGKLDFLSLVENQKNIESIFYLDQNAVADKKTAIIKKANLNNDVFTVTDFTKFDVNSDESTIYVLPRNNNSLLLMKYDSEKKSAKFEVLKNN